MSEAPDEARESGEWTCGRGLAEHSPVPAKMAELLRETRDATKG